MAKRAAKKTTKAKQADPLIRRVTRRIRRWFLRGAALLFLLAVGWIALYALINPPTTPYIFSEARRLGGVDRQWVPIDEVAPVMARSVAAAEDANFCLHWGLDTLALRDAIEDGAARGGSTISQQVVKNVFLWHGRSWLRKGIEAIMTPLMEAILSKRRIMELYLNMVEFDEGVFGVEAAARHYFGIGPEELSSRQAALLASILPNPKGRSASRPSAAMQRKAARVMDGAATIAADGRAACFER